MTSMTYPSWHDYGSWVLKAGSTYTYSYDAMGRPTRLSEYRDGQYDWVRNVSYGPAGEMLHFESLTQTDPYDEYYSENRTYNSRVQLTGINGVATGLTVNIGYTYSPTQNNGRITQASFFGETVAYTYDTLNRLTRAETTGPQRGLSFTYDGFGNRTSQIPTKGTPPTATAGLAPATNRIIGQGYDANRNQTTPNSYIYDVENRLVSVGWSGDRETYAYAPDNKRIWKWREADGTEAIYFYGPGGERLATFRPTESGTTIYMTLAAPDLHFAGRPVIVQGTPVIPDRLGSIVANYGPQIKYYPCGEEQAPSSNATKKFATYYRDLTGLDYANQRYYSSFIGRFLTPDPSGLNESADDPQSWNRYAYVQNDPINLNDPEGLKKCGDILVDPGVALRNLVDPGTESGLFAAVVFAEADDSELLTEAYFKERDAIAMSILNRVALLNGRITIAGINAATLGYGPLGASISQVLGWSGQYQTVTGGPNSPRLSSTAQTRLNRVLNEEQDVPNPDFLIPGSSGLEKMSSACVNLWQSWVVSAEALAGRVKDPFASKGVTTSFHLNTTPSGPLETYFGNAGLATSFFGIVPPPPAIPRGRDNPIPREPGRPGRRR